MHALVIDDSRALRSILRLTLQQAGFTVTEASDGRAGLEALEKLGRPNVVLVDWNMPVMDGLEFVRAVRADARYAGLRLLMITTETETSRMATALEAGADEYVMKPFTKEVILEKLEMLGVLPRQALVVDDSRVTRMILRQMLEQLGFAVSEASDGQQGLEQLSKLCRAGLAVVDANMPGMDGLAFVRAVRAREAHRDLRLVMVTGEEDALQTARAVEEGADAFLCKPFTREAFQESLERLGIVRH